MDKIISSIIQNNNGRITEQFEMNNRSENEQYTSIKSFFYSHHKIRSIGLNKFKRSYFQPP